MEEGARRTGLSMECSSVYDIFFFFLSHELLFFLVRGGAGLVSGHSSLSSVCFFF
jgi:hypothetical protein